MTDIKKQSGSNKFSISNSKSQQPLIGLKVINVKTCRPPSFYLHIPFVFNLSPLVIYPYHLPINHITFYLLHLATTNTSPLGQSNPKIMTENNSYLIQSIIERINAYKAHNFPTSATFLA